MDCVECGEAATVTFREAGVVTALCTSCFARFDHGTQVLIDCFSRPRSTTETCPFCGTTRHEIEERKLAGCGLCYEVFEDVIARMCN